MELDIELEAATPLTLQLESKVGQKVHPLGSEVAFQARNFPPPSPALVYRQPSLPDLQKDGQRYPGLLLQPESRPISHKQLAAEVKSIYVGLTMVEAKCIHVERTVSGAVESLFLDHWQTLITLHNTLLHEHHDFFLASRHPSASLALHRLASKYSTPARMWKHVIHSFLELLRHHIPEAPNHRLAFIYRVHQMIALLYEKAPTFEDTWVECLGDLGRYRMAIEDEDVGDRETWAGVARSWYPKVAYKNPSVGRLYHHLAILASPNALQQTYYYARSLTCVKSFPSARISILALLDPILGTPERAYSRAPPVDASFIQAHGALFEKPSPGRFTEALLHFQSRIYTHICRLALEWAGKRVDVCVSFLNALLHCSSLSALVTCLLRLPIASASAIPTHQEPTGGQDSVYLDDSIVDFLFSALIIIYLALAYWFDPKTRRASLALSVTSATFWVAMVSEGDETFSSSSRWK
ncbi:hypothetical protein P154DRAFT_445225 [Amniculicola lignicola CBS 123094]|uniref:DNA/RNA-binding domain-containing protein n=1 Tax=Amniculicola lignicola CBS 123094 TaxID=1392246 RepID=A0A6A5W5Y8_9PLEO|nr:hypothetical protein P154DRAFT_445225 [Amniculicola lignicola CBS 123094]